MTSDPTSSEAAPARDELAATVTALRKVVQWTRYMRNPTMAYPGGYDDDPRPSYEEFARKYVEPEHARTALAGAINAANMMPAEELTALADSLEAGDLLLIDRAEVCDGQAVGIGRVGLLCSLPVGHAGEHRTEDGTRFVITGRDFSEEPTPKSTTTVVDLSAFPDAEVIGIDVKTGEVKAMERVYSGPATWVDGQEPHREERWRFPLLPREPDQ